MMLSVTPLCHDKLSPFDSFFVASFPYRSTVGGGETTDDMPGCGEFVMVGGCAEIMYL